MTSHVPERPTWRCRACRLEWPCGPARAALAREYAGRPAALAVYLSVQFVDAARDLPATPLPVLRTRIVEWPSARVSLDVP